MHVIKIFCPDFGFRVKMEERIWLINHNGSADLRGLFLEGLIFGGAYLQKEICVSKSIGLAL